jgi:hypothetical protein
MHAVSPPIDESITSRLAGVYTRLTIWYLLMVAVFWAVGFEALYYYPTPWYALWRPAVDSELWRHAVVVGLLALFVAAATGALNRLRFLEADPSRRSTTVILCALILFTFSFAGVVAMIRDGVQGVMGPYTRFEYEYIGDIGFGGSLQGLFRDYVARHELLSMHAKVHPPGPIVMLWILSMFALSLAPLPLAIATMAVGSLALVPLYFWVKDMCNRRVALTACLLYTVVPSIVLFTATSADILFMPLTLTTLFLFWHAIHLPSVLCALGAGIGYAFMSLTSFSLIAIGAFFGFVGLWRLADASTRKQVFVTAAVMIVAFLGVHLAVRAWSGFDVIECFRVCKAQFDTDQENLNMFTPRYPPWAWKVLNPLCWIFFAGIPVSALFFWRLARPESDSKPLFIVIALTLIVLSFLYLARGEGERSAMYVFPFFIIPAAHLLDQLGRKARSLRPLALTLVFLGVQTWLIESFFFTHW